MSINPKSKSYTIATPRIAAIQIYKGPTNTNYPNNLSVSEFVSQEIEIDGPIHTYSVNGANARSVVYSRLTCQNEDQNLFKSLPKSGALFDVNPLQSVFVGIETSPLNESGSVPLNSVIDNTQHQWRAAPLTRDRLTSAMKFLSRDFEFAFPNDLDDKECAIWFGTYLSSDERSISISHIPDWYPKIPFNFPTGNTFHELNDFIHDFFRLGFKNHILEESDEPLLWGWSFVKRITSSAKSAEHRGMAEDHLIFYDKCTEEEKIWLKKILRQFVNRNLAVAMKMAIIVIDGIHRCTYVNHLSFGHYPGSDRDMKQKLSSKDHTPQNSMFMICEFQLSTISRDVIQGWQSSSCQKNQSHLNAVPMNVLNFLSTLPDFIEQVKRKRGVTDEELMTEVPALALEFLRSAKSKEFAKSLSEKFQDTTRDEKFKEMAQDFPLIVSTSDLLSNYLVLNDNSSSKIRPRNAFVPDSIFRSNVKKGEAIVMLLIAGYLTDSKEQVKSFLQQRWKRVDVDSPTNSEDAMLALLVLLHGFCYSFFNHVTLWNDIIKKDPPLEKSRIFVACLGNILTWITDFGSMSPILSEYQVTLKKLFNQTYDQSIHSRLHVRIHKSIHAILLLTVFADKHEPHNKMFYVKPNGSKKKS